MEVKYSRSGSTLMEAPLALLMKMKLPMKMKLLIGISRRGW